MNITGNVFQQITASPEVLAEKLVYLVKEKADSGTYSYWSSTISCDVWLKKSEAIAATVAKLKEICVEQDAVDYTQSRLIKVDDTQKEVAE